VHRWAILTCALLLAGCGGGSTVKQQQATRPPSQAQRLKAVVRAWSARLNAGDNAGLARLFRVPVYMRQGSYVFLLDTRSQVARWHATLPCSGHIVSITVRGRIATAVFRLGNRTTSRCDAPGSLAAARFTIVGGQIIAWEQIPVPPHRSTPVA
jgi:hypothetical protein